MNEMRKLMETLNRIAEVGDDNPPVDGGTFDAGGVRVTIWDTEVVLNNGHGQNIWLRRNEWQDFVDAITGQGLREERVGQRQDSTKDQLTDLIVIAEDNGMYDAADYIKLILQSNFKSIRNVQ